MIVIMRSRVHTVCVGVRIACFRMFAYMCLDAMHVRVFILVCM